MAKDNKSVRQSKKTAGLASTQAHLPIAEIHDDTLILKNGGIRAVIRTSSTNFNLKSEQEQQAILYSYQGFLNTLTFPIQVVVRSKKLDIDLYLEKLKDIGEKQENALLQKQTFEYIDYIQKLVEYADIMEKDFLVIIPFEPYRAKKIGAIGKLIQALKGKDTLGDALQRKKEFTELKKGLSQRVSTVRAGLEGCGLKVEQLKTKELIELFYNIYNPVTGRQEKMTKVEETNIEGNFGDQEASKA